MHAAEDNPLRVSALGFQGETQRISDEISHVLDFWHLVVMRQDDSVLLSR